MLKTKPIAYSLCLFLVTAVSLPGMSFAASNSPRNFSGDFQLAEPKSARAEINGAVDKVVNQLFVFKRKIARKKLAPITNPCADFSVTFPGDDIRFQCGKMDIVTPASGKAKKVVLPGGETLTVQQRIQDGNLVQLFEGKSGSCFREIVPQPNGGLELRVAILSRQLPDTIEYAIDFDPIRRQQAKRE